MAIYCPYCGVSNPDNTKICASCNRPLPELAPDPEAGNRDKGKTEKESPAPEYPPQRPYYPGQPGSEYSYAPAGVAASNRYGVQYAPDLRPGTYPGYDTRQDRVGVAQVDPSFWTRLGAFIIDFILESLIAIIVLVVPVAIWGINFVNRHYQEFEAACDNTSSYDSTRCSRVAEDIFITQGEIWPVIYLTIGFGLLALILTLLYSIGMTASGATIGKRVFGLKVVKLDGSVPGFGTALLRQTVGYFISSLIFMLGFFWILFDKFHQGWHDKLSQTFVVRA